MKLIISILFILMVGHCFSLTEMYLSLSSFIGSYYYPEEKENELSYNDNYDIKFGLKYEADNRVQVFIGHRYRDSFLKSSIELDTFELSYTFNSDDLVGFLIDDIEFAKKYSDFTIDAMNNETFNSIENYRLKGIRGVKSISSGYEASLYLGGNDYNKALFITNLRKESSFYRILFTYLYTTRDNEAYKEMHSLSKDVLVRMQYLYLRNYFNFGFFKDNEANDFTNYAEVVFKNYKQTFKLGASLRFSSRHRGYDDWMESSVFAKYQLNSFDTVLYYNTTRVGSLKRESIKPLLLFQVREDFFIGLNSGAYLSENKASYYSFGIQVTYNDRKTF